jgi:3-oxoacyl-[acyl-carrier-protein] synthase III
MAIDKSITNTKEKILEVAKSLFMKKGVDKTSVRDIARSAGINLAAMNYHFRSKESLFDMIFEHVLATEVPSLQNILNSRLPLEEKIIQYIDSYVNVLVKNPQLPYFVISVLNRDPDKVIKIKVLQSLYSTELFARQLREEAEKGNIRPVDPNHFFINMQSLIHFPFAIQGAMKVENSMNEKDFADFILARKKIISETLILSLRKDQSGSAVPVKNKMYIHSISHYIPEKKVNNAYFSNINGMTESDIFKKSGIRERRMAAPGENTNTMAIEAVSRMSKTMKFPLTDIDLIVAATYTPYDTVATPAHAIQRKFKIKNAKAFFVSSACSSFVTAVEIVEGYFSSGKANKALVVVAEHNTAFNDETNILSGFLWGDGAAAMVVTRERQSEDDLEVLDISAEGLAHISKGPDAVYCRINAENIQMPEGKDVFVNASQYMTSQTIEILERNHFKLDDLSYFIPHQANIRIINKVGKDLAMHNGKLITNIEYLGNTGCAGCAIGLSEHWKNFRKDDLIAIAVFGGGYSSGCLLLKK